MLMQKESILMQIKPLIRHIELIRWHWQAHIRTYSHLDYFRAAYISIYRQGTQMQCPVAQDQAAKPTPHKKTVPSIYLFEIT